MIEAPALCIADANILIDLHHGGVLALLARLPYRCLIPDLVRAELASPPSERIDELGFEIAELSGASVLELFALRPAHAGLAVADLAALLVARDRRGILLTGDGALRRLAEQRAQAVHGVLWVLDEMVRHGLLAPEGACTALEAVLAGGARLPERACAKMRERWANR
ncbi:MAG: PIN domain-containing protein [Chloroflexi bacterium]|nr:PIN domain-containing protein [Chloroflexota bacterium]